jgi:hypothetical protein
MLVQWVLFCVQEYFKIAKEGRTFEMMCDLENEIFQPEYSAI